VDGGLASVWASPLGRWLRGLVDDPSSNLPAFSRIIDAARRELGVAEELAVLFVRFETWGGATRSYGWRDIQAVYEAASSIAMDMVGHGLRRVDVPGDLGLKGEGFAILLSGPRGSDHVDLDVARVVADRVADLVRARLVDAVAVDLAERTTVEVGAGLVSRPAAGATTEDALVTGLVMAERDAAARHDARVADFGRQLRGAVEGGDLDVAFEPIVMTGSGDVLGFDAVLQGPAGTELAHGDVVLDVAARTGQEFRVTDLYHQTALVSAEGGLEDGELLVLRVAADELLESAVRLMSAFYHRERARLTSANVLFLVDSEGLAEHFPVGLSVWRSVGEMGFRLGVDLSPNRPLPLDFLKELGPDIVRVGGRSVREIHRHQDEFEHLLMLSRFATRHGTHVLAADCADRREFSALRRAGISYVQGDFVAPPSPTLARPEPGPT
jgi:EAL domain-containing protein (putative c-di-GMP-specific phosphodiesterase class I)